MDDLLNATDFAWLTSSGKQFITLLANAVTEYTDQELVHVHDFVVLVFDCHAGRHIQKQQFKLILTIISQIH